MPSISAGQTDPVIGCSMVQQVFPTGKKRKRQKSPISVSLNVCGNLF